MAIIRVPIATYKYMGLSSDTKPTGVPAGSEFWEYDRGYEFTTYDGDNWVAKPLVGSHKHLIASGQVKGSKGILFGVVINRPDTTAGATITLYDSLDASGTVIAVITVDVAKYVIPSTLIYNVTFENGLYASFSHAVTADITVSYR